MRYSIEPKDVKGYGFLSFAKNMCKNIGKNLSGKYSQNLLDSAKKSTTDAVKTASKRVIQKTAEATGDYEITKTSKIDKNELEIRKERYISPEERQQIIDELRLI